LPSDLKGKKIGIVEYQLTANVWVRAILQEYGVSPSDINWVRGGMDSAERPEKLKFTPPDDVTFTLASKGRSLNEMLAAGEIDGFVDPRRPRCFSEGYPHVGRLFADSQSVAMQWYKQRQIFPIMHVLGVRRSLANRHPWLPGALLEAFSQSKVMASAALADTSATKVTMPFVEDTLRFADQLKPNIWSYGVTGNEHVLEALLVAHQAQGLSPRKLEVSELFHSVSCEGYSL
jgi:4,5-dihydroxyphthalate decarboxylase